ncbi:MAG: hypothetical protein AAB547_02210 [Patescibacteria group bacterium]
MNPLSAASPISSLKQNPDPPSALHEANRDLAETTHTSANAKITPEKTKNASNKTNSFFFLFTPNTNIRFQN